MSILKNKVVFLTGGTGSFGKEFVKHCTQNYPDIRKLIIFSRDELKQHEMQQVFSDSKYPFLRYFIGDIRDKERLITAMEDVDIVIHAAALKHVSVAEYNPSEFIKTNILGTQNLLDISLQKSIESFIALSTDKASSPVNLYGATKLCADKLVISSNNIRGTRNTKFSVVRYGNVFGSRGSIVPLFLKQSKTNKLTVTDRSMTRFNISLSDGVAMVMWSLANSRGGEIFVPKIPSYRIMDMVEAIGGKDCKVEEIGIRPGEKIHEEMISSADSLNTVELSDYFAILPSDNNDLRESYITKDNAKVVEPGFNYSSGTNHDFLDVNDLKNILKNYTSDESKSY